MLLNVLGNGKRMFDGLAVNVHEIQRAIGGIHKIRGAEPVVGGCQKFVSLIGTDRAECGPLRCQDLAMDQVAADITDERISAKLIPIGAATINGHACGRCKEPCGIQL